MLVERERERKLALLEATDVFQLKFLGNSGNRRSVPVLAARTPVAKHFSELVCYQLGRELRKDVFSLTTQPAFNCDLKLRSQLRGAASSVCSNIAEGFGRATHRDFARFLDMSRASINEIEDRLGESVERKYLKAAEIDRALNLGKRTRVATSRLMAYLKRTPDP
jgi:four helix bundle protein